MASFLYLFSSLLNFPLITIGDNAVGIFDIVFTVVILTTLVFSKKMYVNELSYFFLFVFILGIASSIRYLDAFDLPSLAYLLKFLQIAMIPMTLSAFTIGDVSRREQIVFLCLILCFFYVSYDFFTSLTRGRAPFLYNGSGPLGLIATIYIFIGYFNTSSLRKYILITMGMFLLLMALSKSFILSVGLMVLIHAIKFYKRYANVKKLIQLVSIIALAMLFMHEIGFDQKFINLYETITNLRGQRTYTARVANHWFVNFDAHILSYDVAFGHGIPNIPFSYDSLYFYCFYVFGIVGSSCLIAIVVILWLKGSLIFRYYIFILFSSGLFLETALISYRGLEPFVLILTFFSINNPRVKI